MIEYFDTLMVTSAHETDEAWYEQVAASVDAAHGAAYDYTISLLKDFAGVSETDAEQDYTYYGIPAAAASPNIFEEFD